MGTCVNCGAGALECGGKRKRDTALATRERDTTPILMPRRFLPAIPSQGGVALTLPSALQGALRASMCPPNFERCSHFPGTTGCVHARSISSGEATPSFFFDDMTRARTYSSSPLKSYRASGPSTVASTRPTSAL